MTSDGERDDEGLELDPAVVAERFRNLFGVSEDQLRAQGVDPGQYARDHIHDALKDRTKWEGILPASNQYGILWTRWGFRGFVAMFIGFGLLALSKIRAIRWVAIGAACVDLAVVLAMYVAMLIYRGRYVQACRAEGKSPRWARR